MRNKLREITEDMPITACSVEITRKRGKKYRILLKAADGAMGWQYNVKKETYRPLRWGTEAQLASYDSYTGDFGARPHMRNPYPDYSFATSTSSDGTRRSSQNQWRDWPR